MAAATTKTIQKKLKFQLLPTQDLIHLITIFSGHSNMFVDDNLQMMKKSKMQYKNILCRW